MEIDNDFGDYFDEGTTRAPYTVSYINEAGVPEEVAEEAVGRIRDELASQMDTWSRQLNSEINGTGSSNLFFRNRYSLSAKVFDQFRACSDAVEYDNILSTTSDVLEALAFQSVTMESNDTDEANIWNQIAEDIEIDARLREVFREIFKVSQCYVGVIWGNKSYKVETNPIEKAGPPDPLVEDPESGALVKKSTLTGKDGEESTPAKRARRKEYDLVVPRALTILDPTKVLPVGQLMFGMERYAYLASKSEHDAFMASAQNVLAGGEPTDGLSSQMLEGWYSPNASAEELNLAGGSSDYMWLFKPQALFRHTMTKAQYERFAAVRLNSIMAILDQKQQLMASDRAHLIGSTNFIIVLKRGSDAHPAKPGEVAQLRSQARTLARMPILVGPHDLSVEIITPNMDFTLSEERYRVLDSRLLHRALGTFDPGLSTAEGDANQMSQVVSRSIEGRRRDIVSTFKNKLFRLIQEVNEDMDDIPTVALHPRRVIVDWDVNIINGILKLRDRGDLSRETTLEEFDYDQDVEALRRKEEAELYDPFFKSSIPFSSPDSNPFGNQPGQPGQGKPQPGQPGAKDNGRPNGAKTGSEPTPTPPKSA